eukprot:SAG31_NODE_532_length_14374_cov_30.565254_12_plen_72_part_00
MIKLCTQIYSGTSKFIVKINATGGAAMFTSSRHVLNLYSSALLQSDNKFIRDRSTKLSTAVSHGRRTACDK